MMKKLISLFLTELFLFSSILPAWAAPADCLRPRSSVHVDSLISSLTDPAQQSLPDLRRAPKVELSLAGLTVTDLQKAVEEVRAALTQEEPNGFVELRYRSLSELDSALTDHELAPLFEMLRNDPHLHVVLITRASDLAQDTFRRWHRRLQELDILVAPIGEVIGREANDGGNHFETLQGIKEGQIGALFPYFNMTDLAPGMARDLYETYPSIRKIYENASLRSGYPLDALFLEKDPKDPTLYQLATALYSIALYRALEGNLGRPLQPKMLAGYSSGIFPALVISGALSLEGMIDYLVKGAKVMEDVAAHNHYGLLTIFGVPYREIEPFLLSGRVELLQGVSPEYLIVGVKSGVDVEALKETIIQKTGGRVRYQYPPPVKVPHHSFYSEGKGEIGKIVDALTIQDPKTPIVASSLKEGFLMRASDVARELREGFFTSVFWDDTLLRMRQNGVALFMEVGPGRTLARINEKLTPDIPTVNIDREESVGMVAEVLRTTLKARDGGKKGEAAHLSDRALRAIVDEEVDKVFSNPKPWVKMLQKIKQPFPDIESAIDWIHEEYYEIAQTDIYVSGHRRRGHLTFWTILTSLWMNKKLDPRVDKKALEGSVQKAAVAEYAHFEKEMIQKAMRHAWRGTPLELRHRLRKRGNYLLNQKIWEAASEQFLRRDSSGKPVTREYFTKVMHVVMRWYGDEILERFEAPAPYPSSDDPKARAAVRQALAERDRKKWPNYPIDLQRGEHPDRDLYNLAHALEVQARSRGEELTLLPKHWASRKLETLDDWRREFDDRIMKKKGITASEIGNSLGPERARQLRAIEEEHGVQLAIRRPGGSAGFSPLVTDVAHLLITQADVGKIVDRLEKHPRAEQHEALSLFRTHDRLKESTAVFLRTPLGKSTYRMLRKPERVIPKEIPKPARDVPEEPPAPTPVEVPALPQPMIPEPMKEIIPFPEGYVPKEGTPLSHDHYGEGWVVSMGGEGDGAKIEIEFKNGEYGKKKFGYQSVRSHLSVHRSWLRPHRAAPSRKLRPISAPPISVETSQTSLEPQRDFKKGQTVYGPYHRGSGVIKAVEGDRVTVKPVKAPQIIYIGPSLEHLSLESPKREKQDVVMGRGTFMHGMEDALGSSVVDTRRSNFTTLYRSAGKHASALLEKVAELKEERGLEWLMQRLPHLFELSKRKNGVTLEVIGKLEEALEAVARAKGGKAKDGGVKDGAHRQFDPIPLSTSVRHPSQDPRLISP